MHRSGSSTNPSRAAWLAGSAAIGSTLLLSSRAVRGADNPLLKIATVPREPACECFYAQDQGFFQKRGLSVEMTMMSNGAAISAAVAGGALQVGNTNVLALAQAHQHNVPLIMIAPAGFTIPDSPTVPASSRRTRQW